MFFQPTTDQRDLIDDAFSRPLGELLPIARLHGARAPEPWNDLAALGLFGIAADPEIGGVGLGAVEEALLAIELGAKLAHPGILATLMAQHLAAGPMLDGIVAGTTRAALAYIAGDRLCAIDAAGADLLLVRGGGRAALLPADALTGASPLDEVHWTLPLSVGAIDPAALDWAGPAAERRVRLIEAAALAGIATLATGMAVDYAQVREQFGHAIGGFQAIKHHCANMGMGALAARDLATFAAVAVAEDRADAGFQVEAALLAAIDAALLTVRKNIQVHGGMGFSDEADPHLALKRAQLLIEAAGGAEAAAERVAAAEPAMRA